MHRRGFLGAGATVLLGLAAAACGGTKQSTRVKIDRSDLPGSFAKYAPASEPNADLSKITWPSFVTSTDPEVKTLYEFQLTHGELMRYMPCYCGCGQTDGHRNNRDCYVKQVNQDGSAVLDSMAPT